MSAALALAAAQAAGVRISIDGDALALDADAPPPPDVLALLAENKLGIIALLRSERRGPELPSLAEPAAAAIPPAAVRAAYEATVERLTTDHARPPDAAKAEALDILRVELRRDPRLIPPQVDPWRCVTCGKPEAPAMPLLAVATNEPDQHRWMHAGPCHQRYRERLTEAVETVMTGAGLLRPSVVPEAAE